MSFKTTQLIILFALLLGCTTTSPYEETLSAPPPKPPVPYKTAVIFIPGFKGSELKNDANDIIWISGANGIFNLHSLALPIPGLGINNGGENLRPGGVLKDVPILFGLFSYDVYQSTLKKIIGILPADVQFVPFGFDWRQDLSGTATLLGAEISKLHREGITDITLIAHSMGGLVTSYYLRYGSHDIDTAVENWEGLNQVNRVIFAGTPFRGAITIFNDMQIGIPAGLNTSLLDSEALGTFPVSYQLMPGSNQSTFISPTSADIPNAMHDASLWRKYRWGFLSAEQIDEAMIEARTKYITVQLQRGDRFSQLINAPITNSPKVPTKILNIVGIGKPTMNQAILEPTGRTTFTEKLLHERFPLLADSAIFADGDSVVPEQSATLPLALQFPGNSSEVRLATDHGGVISSDDSILAIKKFLEAAK